MAHVAWYLVVGGVLVLVAVGGSLLKRLPVSTAMLYLAIGYALGPSAAGLIRLDPVHDGVYLELAAEVAVIVSLFTAGLKLRIPFRDRRWLIPIRLAVVSMTLTVGLLAVAAWYLLDLSWGAAILLGGMLAPTDPVLASDVQVLHPSAPDPLRLNLTAEAGLNDGTASPFVLLGLGLLGAHQLGPVGSRWLAVDVLWGTAAGLAIGALLGTAVGRFILYLRREHREGLGPDEFLALGLMALAYGAALAVNAYGFLAVFAAGLTLRRVELQETGDETPPEVDHTLAGEESKHATATDARKAPAYLAQAVLRFNEQLDRIGEVAIVLLVGGLLATQTMPSAGWALILLLLFVIRPLSVLIGLAGSGATGIERRLTAWFGIRGIGSIYYLGYAITHGLSPELAESLAPVVLMTVAVSIVVHGISSTPLMALYGRWFRRAEA